jgi:acyl carrier protein
VACWTEGGLIEYRGRADQQTKIMGCRVEPREVEVVLGRHPRVQTCAVVALPDETGANQLVAYVVGDRAAVADLGAHAERHLPRYMQPAAYVFVDELPLTPSGKLDRLKLPAPTGSDYEARAGGQGPQTALEAELIELWKQVLRLERLGRSDNFFAVGGNSLKSIQVLTRLKETYGIEVSVRDFFAAPTVEGLAALIERALVELVASLSDEEAERRLKDF